MDRGAAEEVPVYENNQNTDGRNGQTDQVSPRRAVKSLQSASEQSGVAASKLYDFDADSAASSSASEAANKDDHEDVAYRDGLPAQRVAENRAVLLDAAELLGKKYGTAELDRLVAQYCDAYYGIYGVIDASMSEDEATDIYMKYLEEICADAYAQIRRGGLNIAKAEAAMETYRTDTQKQTAAATERTNGPNEKRYSISPDAEIEEENIRSGTNALNWLIDQAKKSDNPEVLIKENAIYRTDIGQIDFVWGKPGTGAKFKHGYGMAHIIEKHGENVARNVIEVLAKGTESDTQKNDMVSEGHERVRIYYNGYSAVLNKRPDANHWLLTGWKNDKETGAYAAVEVYDSTGATADGTTRFHPNGVNATVSNDSISDTSIKGNRFEEKFSVEDDSQYLSLAEKYRDGDITAEETEQLKEAIEPTGGDEGLLPEKKRGGTDYAELATEEIDRRANRLLQQGYINSEISTHAPV